MLRQFYETTMDYIFKNPKSKYIGDGYKYITYSHIFMLNQGINRRKRNGNPATDRLRAVCS